METKRCNKCGIDKPLDAFRNRKKSRDGKQFACRECQVSYKAERIEKYRANRRQAKITTLAAYCEGEVKCAVCGFNDPRALSIDHINGDGNKHRRSIFKGENKAGEAFYHWLRDNDYPEGYQVLCMNCQFIKKHS